MVHLQADRGSAAGIAALVAVAGQDAGAARRRQRPFAPALWWFEVANALRAAVRRGRISSAAWRGVLDDLSVLPIVLDEQAPARAWTATLELAERTV